MKRPQSGVRAIGTRRAVGTSRQVGTSYIQGPNMNDLWEYQKAGVRWLSARRRALLADEPGVGKTVQALRALPQEPRVIVLGPASAAITWRDEAARWRPDLQVTLGKSLRKPDVGELFFLSADSLPPITRGMKQLLPVPMRDVTLIPDECQMFRRWQAGRTQSMRRLSWQCGRVWGLSGTPMPGKPEDLWGLLLSLGLQDEVCPGGWEEFVSLCSGKKQFIRDKRAGGILRMIGYEWGDIDPVIHERLKSVMLRRCRHEVLSDLPKCQYVKVKAHTPEDLREYLNEVSERWSRLNLSPEDLPPFEMLSEARAALATSRIPMALELAETYAQSFPLLVFSAHVKPILAMRELKSATIITGETTHRERSQRIAAFKEGRKRILAMTIETGGVSLNLQEAGAILFIDRDYTPGNNLQAELRAARPGSKHSSVLIYIMQSDHALDLRLQEILDTKQQKITEIVDG